MTSEKKPAPKSRNEKAPNPGFAFLLEYMKKHPDAAYADAAAAAADEGHKIFPIMWGRAQTMLGRVKARPRGQGKAAEARKAAVARKAATREAGEEVAPAPAPARARPAAPRRIAPAEGAPAQLAIEPSDLERARGLVERINAGHRAVLVYDGDTWVLAVE